MGEARASDLDCLRAASAGGAEAEVRHGLDLLDRALARNLRQIRELDDVAPGASLRVLQNVSRRWPELLRGLRRDVAMARRRS